MKLGGLLQIVLLLMFIAGCSHTSKPKTVSKKSTSVKNSRPSVSPSDQKTIKELLDLDSAKMISYHTGSDAGGCSWDLRPDPKNPNLGSPEEILNRKKLIEELFNLKAWETASEGAPVECQSAYTALETNSYSFPDGALTIPPSGLYPAPTEGMDVNFYQINWTANSENSKPSRVFCVKRSEILHVTKKYPKATEKCEF